MEMTKIKNNHYKFCCFPYNSKRSSVLLMKCTLKVCWAQNLGKLWYLHVIPFVTNPSFSFFFLREERITLKISSRWGFFLLSTSSFFLKNTVILRKGKKKMRLNGSSIYNLIFLKVDWNNSVKASYSMEVMTISYCGLPKCLELSLNFK